MHQANEPGLTGHQNLIMVLIQPEPKKHIFIIQIALAVEYLIENSKKLQKKGRKNRKIFRKKIVKNRDLFFSFFIC